MTSVPLQPMRRSPHHSVDRGQRPAGLSAVLLPRSVAIIGASADPSRIGGRPIAGMLAMGFRGEILPVNPNRDVVQGLQAYPSIGALPRTPDVAIVAVPAASVERTIEELGLRGTRSAIVFSAGFAEAGEAGATLQSRVVAVARRYGMRLLGPNSLGLFNTANGFFGTFSTSVERGYPTSGSVGIASQSGAFGMHIVSMARDERIGLSCCVTTGNEADLDISDAIGWMADDEGTQVIVAYAEGIRDGSRLLAGLRRARQNRKPVVMMKVGRSAIGSAAATSHTASIAGDDAVVDTVLREYGVVRAHSTEQMLDIARLATRRIFPVCNTLGVLTISGGAGVLISDAADAMGLAMPPMPEAAQEALRRDLPFCSPQNPVDCTAQVLNDLSAIGRFGRALVNDGGYGSILLFFTHAGGAPSIAGRLREEIRALRNAHPDRLYVLSVLADPPQIRAFEEDGLLVYPDPSRAVAAIEAMGRFGESFEIGEPETPPPAPKLKLPVESPNEAEAKRLLREAGIRTVDERVCSSAEEAVAAAEELGFPVVLKILSSEIQHKTEVGGVIVGIADDAAVRDGFVNLIARVGSAVPQARIDGVLVAKQMVGGVECILGIHRDPVFGPIAMFGLGGIFTEVMKDVCLRKCPFSITEAEVMIRSIRGAQILQGARGHPPADIQSLAKMLSHLSVVADQAEPELIGIDLNPVFAMPAGQGVFAADAVIYIRSHPKSNNGNLIGR